jgi:hypothetical protein
LRAVAPALPRRPRQRASSRRRLDDLLMVRSACSARLEPCVLACPPRAKASAIARILDRRRVRRLSFPACAGQSNSPPSQRGRAERRGAIAVKPARSRARKTATPRSPVHVVSLDAQTSSPRGAGSPASRARCERLAPRRPRWTSLSGDPASPFELEGRLSTAMGPNGAQHV